MKLTKREQAQQRRARQEAFQQRREEAKNRSVISFSEEYRNLAAQDNRTVYENYDNQAQQLKRKKKRRLGMFYALFGSLFAVVGILVLCMMFFNVKNIHIQGNTHYPEEELLAASGIKVGDNLLALNDREIQQRITQAFPYVASVKVERKWPETVILVLKETQPAYAFVIQEGVGYALLSESMKVLEIGVTSLEGLIPLCEVQGIQCVDPQPGQQAQFDSENSYEAFCTLTAELAKQEYADTQVTYLDLSDPIDLTFTYEDRLQIRLGSTVQLEYKLQYAKYLIENEIDPRQKGILNMLSVASGKASFQPKTQIVDGEYGQVDEFYFPPEAEKPYDPYGASSESSETP